MMSCESAQPKTAIGRSTIRSTSALCVTMSTMPCLSFSAAFSLMRENMIVMIGTPMTPVMTEISRNA